MRRVRWFGRQVALFYVMRVWLPALIWLSDTWWTGVLPFVALAGVAGWAWW